MKKKYKVLFFILLLTVTMFTKVNANEIVSSSVFCYENKDGKFNLNKDTEIFFQGRNEVESREILNICTYMKMKFIVPTGYDLKLIKGGTPKENSIVLTTVNSDESLGVGGYILDIDKNMIKINAYTSEGIFRGVQRLIQMMPPEIEMKELMKDVEWSVPATLIKDRPKNEVRGLMIDVAKFFDDK